MNAAPLPAAVFWDMDGTLIDSEPYWLAEETALVESFGGVWSAADGLQLVGSSLEGSALILQSRGVAMTTQQIIDHLTDRVMARIAGEVPWRPGARELLSALRDAGVPTALVTMSIRRMAEPVVAALGFPGFDALVAGDQVDEGKPAPECYLRAAELLGVDPARSVAIEDSEYGVAAGVAAGMATIAVPLHVPLPESPSYTLWPGLDGKTPADLAAVLAARRAGAQA
ncbi:MAG TPA: HAD family phosphatase [Pseudolysinimonas sp.]|nr:HAD family phosphatase [Pseudolysinimonas sp.]